MSNGKHWQEVYAHKAPSSVSWFQDQPAPSLAMISATGLGPEASVIDVGAGASALVDNLLDRGFDSITVLDVSSQALAVTRARLAGRAAKVRWVVADLTAWAAPTAAFDIWHDRAVFHFLVSDEDHRAYVTALERALRPDGFVILATFSLSGPERCSGLPVMRHSPATLSAALGPGFVLIHATAEVHKTPGGATQDFIWCLFHRTAVT